jgi:hypothetical protein
MQGKNRSVSWWFYSSQWSKKQEPCKAAIAPVGSLATRAKRAQAQQASKALRLRVQLLRRRLHRVRKGGRNPTSKRAIGGLVSIFALVTLDPFVQLLLYNRMRRQLQLNRYLLKSSSRRSASGQKRSFWYWMHERYFVPLLAITAYYAQILAKNISAAQLAGENVRSAHQFLTAFFIAVASCASCDAIDGCRIRM